MSTADLLFELGTEELPAGEIDSMVTALYESILNGLKDAGLPFAEARYFSTPRRLAVLVRGVAVKGPDIQRSVVGPPLSAAQTARVDGLKLRRIRSKAGVAPDALAIVEEQGVARIVAHGRRMVPTQRQWSLILLPGLSWPSRFPSGCAGALRHEFLRPVQWLVLMLGEQPFPHAFRLSSGNESRGHRFHHNSAVQISSPGGYQEALRAAHVLCDADERRVDCRASLRIGRRDESVALADDLLDEVAGLVEWPVALRGSFDERFLEVPAQASSQR